MVRAFGMSLVAALVLAVPALAEIGPGEKAPEFKGLPGVDGKQYNLADMKGAKAVVVCFTCNICPVSVAYEDRFVEFTKKYKAKGVEFIAINCNKNREGLDVMKTRAEEKGFNFPYVFDKTGALATEYGARVTPHLFVLDGERKVQYVGAFDNKMKDPTENHVADAVDAILAGKKVEVKGTKAFGCGIANK